MSSPSNRSKHQALIDEAPIGIFEIDGDGRYVGVNQAARDLVGYSEAELLDMSITDLHPNSETPEDVDLFSEVKEHGQARTETTLRQKTGDSVGVILNAAHIDDRIVGYVEEITELRAYERELEEQRDNLRILNQVVRHDIRNDMTVVRGRAHLLEEHIDEGHAGWDDLRAVQEATESAIELTKTARDLAETMLSTEDDVEPVRLDHRLRTPVENARSAFENAVITIDDGLPEVCVRGNKLLEAVFRNLIQNAVVHNDKTAPTVHISMTHADEIATVAIADNGPGIPDEQKKTIFGKGEKGLDSPGTGVGLYLVKTLIEQYGGDIRVEDNDPEGAVFVVELPIVE